MNFLLIVTIPTDLSLHTETQTFSFSVTELSTDHIGVSSCSMTQITLNTYLGVQQPYKHFYSMNKNTSS